MLEGLICPVCENTIEEIDLKESLKCPNCAANLKDRKYLDFLEFLMANGIVENLDFFDPLVYSDDVDDLDQTQQEEGDPSQFEKKKDPKNRAYYWYGRIEKIVDEPGTDVNAISENYISMTPIQCDITDYKALAELKKFELKKK